MAFANENGNMSVLSYESEKEAADSETPNTSPKGSETDASLQRWRRREQVYEALDDNSGNRTVNDDNVLDFLRELTVDVDKEVYITYRRGQLDAWNSLAPVIKVGIHYVPGADLAQVNMMENSELNKDADVLKSARWKGRTAGSLLLEQEVQRDLRILHVDQTPKVIAAYRARKGGNKIGHAVEGIKDLAKTGPNDTVNISSKYVTLLNAYSEKGRYDLESTCIEVDGMSLLNLIYNFRNLISKQGQFATISAQETLKILETMIEDARRLLIRSPILTRATKRLIIQTSCNTRYGMDNGSMFHTITTSRGIAEMIQQGVGYYSSLNGYDEEMAKIRPQFLQMVVFLLSLLNNADLERLKPSLEMSYDLKADRMSIELTIFKVLTYAAVSPYTFLLGITSSIKGTKVDLEDTENGKNLVWDELLSDIGKSGWILPGQGTQVGRGKGSWMVEWNKNFMNSDVFDNLQYDGEKNTVNYIPPLKVNSEALAAQEALAELSNGQIYSLTVKDLDDITNAKSNRYYVVQQANRQTSEITVNEEILFSDLDIVWEDLNRICTTVNEHSNTQRSAVSRGGSFRSFFKTGTFRDSKHKYFDVQKPLGRRTKHTTYVSPGQTSSADIIAISWKLEGRRITRIQLLKGINADIVGFQKCLGQLKEFKAKQDKVAATSGDEYLLKLVKQLEKVIRTVERMLYTSDEQRIGMRNEFSELTKPDEPISRVYFNGNVHQKQSLPFCNYNQKLSENTMRLTLTSERYVVAEEPVWESKLGYVRLGGELSIVVAPLPETGSRSLADDDFEGEVSKGETVLLLGGFVAVFDPQSHRVVNFLHLVDVNRGPAPKRRRRDPNGGAIKYYATEVV